MFFIPPPLFRNLGYAIVRVNKSNGGSYMCANVTGP